jgi:hypothetical protein
MWKYVTSGPAEKYYYYYHDVQQQQMWKYVTSGSMCVSIANNFYYYYYHYSVQQWIWKLSSSLCSTAADMKICHLRLPLSRGNVAIAENYYYYYHDVQQQRKWKICHLRLPLARGLMVKGHAPAHEVPVLVLHPSNLACEFGCVSSGTGDSDSDSVLFKTRTQTRLLVEKQTQNPSQYCLFKRNK